MLLGQSRVFFSMSRDGLLPKLFSDIHPKFRTPWRSNLLFMVFVSLFSGFLPISSLGNMTSIGTLLAFVIVCAGVMVMRRTHPEPPRPYRTPLVPLVPILGILVCFAMMALLDVMTWIRLVVWLVIGFVVYFGYSRYPQPPGDRPRIGASQLTQVNCATDVPDRDERYHHHRPAGHRARGKRQSARCLQRRAATCSSSPPTASPPSIASCPRASPARAACSRRCRSSGSTF